VPFAAARPARPHGAESGQRRRRGGEKDRNQKFGPKGEKVRPRPGEKAPGSAADRAGGPRDATRGGLRAGPAGRVAGLGRGRNQKFGQNGKIG
jgi:hypothetical protein